MPAKFVKITKKVTAEPITNYKNSSILKDTYSDELKIADINPVFKKEDQNNTTNYRPIELLSQLIICLFCFKNI